MGERGEFKLSPTHTYVYTFIRWFKKVNESLEAKLLFQAKKAISCPQIMVRLVVSRGAVYGNRSVVSKAQSGLPKAITLFENHYIKLWVPERQTSKLIRTC